MVWAWEPVLTAVERYSSSAPPGSVTSTQQESALLSAVEDMRTSHPAVGLCGDLVDERPGRALIDASSSASLVVVGSHGTSALAEALLGSVTHDVLHKAHCPVAVVK